jgi:hypothetical protein
MTRRPPPDDLAILPSDQPVTRRLQGRCTDAMRARIGHTNTSTVASDSIFIHALFTNYQPVIQHRANALTIKP